MVRKILQIGAPLLEKKTESVSLTDIKTEKIQSLIIDLVDTCDKMKDRSAGLSANQIGESPSVCVCRRTDIEEELDEREKGSIKTLAPNDLWEVMINPKITVKSDKESAFWEGCLSIGETEKETIFGPVWRPDTITIEYYDREGESKTLEAKGFFAHVVQHEIDHINGILFISLVPNPASNLWKAPALDEYVKQHDTYPNISE